jgi:hypothetical protein
LNQQESFPYITTDTGSQKIPVQYSSKNKDQGEAGTYSNKQTMETAFDARPHINLVLSGYFHELLFHVVPWFGRRDKTQGVNKGCKQLGNDGYPDPE